MPVVFGIIYTWLYCTLMCLALSQHHAAWPCSQSSITSPGSHVPQHRWSQHHVSRLALMLDRSHVPSSSYPQFVPHPRFAQAIPGLSAQSAIHGLRKTIHGWSRSTVCAEQIHRYIDTNIPRDVGRCHDQCGARSGSSQLLRGACAP